MAKKLKFPLLLRENYPVRTMEELREYFDFEKILNYYQNGKLLSWLKDHDYTVEAEEVQQLTPLSPNFAEQLSKIFCVSASDTKPIDITELTEKQKILNCLKQYTSDETIFEHWNQVAFNQEDLSDLLDEGNDIIYLCSNQYRIPLSLQGKHYIGIGKPKVILNVTPPIDLSTLGIDFTDVALYTANGKPISSVSLEKAEALYYACQMQAAAPMLQDLVEFDDNRARCLLGLMYIDGVKFTHDFNKGYALLQEGSANGDVLCRFWLAINTSNGFQDTYEDFLNPLKILADTGDPLCLYTLGLYYIQGGDNKNLELLQTYVSQAADSGYWRAYRTLGMNYEYGRGVSRNHDTAKEYYRKASELGDHSSQIYLGKLLVLNPQHVDEGISWVKKGYSAAPYQLETDIVSLTHEVDNYEPNFYELCRMERGCFYDWTSSRNTDYQFSSKSSAQNYLYEQLNILCQTLANNCSLKNSRFMSMKNSGIGDFKNLYRKFIILLIAKIETVGLDLDSEEIISVLKTGMTDKISKDLIDGLSDIWDSIIEEFSDAYSQKTYLDFTIESSCFSQENSFPKRWRVYATIINMSVNHFSETLIKHATSSFLITWKELWEELLQLYDGTTL